MLRYDCITFVTGRGIRKSVGNSVAEMAFIDKALKIGLAVVVAAILLKLALMPPAAIVNHPLDTYDFIIVGAGSAGSVLAARLSEHHSVLLIEAGGDFSWMSSVPLAAPFIQGTTNDWQFRTVPQAKSSNGLVGQVSYWPRGKGLGGSGRLNYLVHYPGTKTDWNEIVLSGGEGWTHPVMTHYMAKLRGKPYRAEDFQITHNSKSDDNTPKKCPPNIQGTISRTIRQEKPSIILRREDATKNPILKALIAAGQELRHLSLKISPGESTIRKGRRWSSYESHLNPAMLSNSKLHVLLHHRATKIHFQGKHATEVVVSNDDGDTRRVVAQKEIIISAGAIGTPQLLQLSGIGPEQLLSQHKIEMVADLPVGMNLYDHLNVPLYVSLEEPVSLTINKILKISQVVRYFLFWKGPFSKSAVTGTVTAGDIGLLFFGMGTTEEKLFRVISNFDYDVFNTLFPHHKNHSSEGMIIMCSCLRPLSRGSVQVESTDPFKPPLIDPKYLENEQDVTCYKKAIQLARRLLLTTPFQQLGAKLHLPDLQNCSEFEPNIGDSDYLECLIRTVGITGYHPGGTAAMGRVLDSAFRLKTVSGLRVVDSSAIPVPLLGAPNSILLSMADRAANLVLTEYNTTHTHE